MGPVVVQNSLLDGIQYVQNIQYTAAILNAIYCEKKNH